MLKESDYKYGPFSSLDGFNGRCDFALNDGVVTAGFSGKEGSYVINFDLPSSAIAVGVQASIKLSDWKSIQYIAIGYSKSLGFRHIKINNIRQDACVSVGFTHQDIIWLLQNSAEKKDATEIKNIRLFVKGEPADSGAKLQVSQLKLVLQPHDNSLQPNVAEQGPLLDVLYEHLDHALRNYTANAKVYMQTGNCPMPGDQVLDWPSLQRLPEGLEQVSTYRATWHAQHLPINLLQYARQTGQVGPVFAAKALIESWLEHSFYTADVDVKYAWYDHGTAERQLAFILMWFKAIELQMEQRFLDRLAEAILQQTRLLDSEAFYAYHQPLRYHNHAWFQDAALLATALAFKHHTEADGWCTNAISRFEDQLDTLIVRDGGYAIFVENSIGYHHGVQRLAQLIGNMAALSGRDTEIPIIANELVAWSDFLRYPDGRAPAQGDTFRLPPRTGDDVRRGEPWAEPGCTILPKAGYAVVKGNHNNKPWMLCLFNTSLSRTHKHEDNCSITLWFDGVEWLTDPSFYSHEYNEEIPKYLRSAAAHNCVSIPGKEYSLEPGKAKLEGKVEDGKFYIKASHSCYEGVEVVREIDGCLTEVGFQISDKIENCSSIIGQQNIIFPEDVGVRTAGDCFFLESKVSPFIFRLVKGGDVGSEIVERPISTTFMRSEIRGKLITSFLVGSQMSFSLGASESLVTRSPESEPKLSWNEQSCAAAFKNKKVAIIGSCVTRDIMQYLQPK